MRKPERVSAKRFVDELEQWSVKAETAPVEVTGETGERLGYFISEHEFEELVRVRGGFDRKALWAWEADEELAAELAKPVAPYPHELDERVED